MKMKKMLSFLTAAAMTASCAVGMAVTANAAEESDLEPITASMTRWFDDDTANGTVGVAKGSLFGDGYFYTSTGNSAANNKGNNDGHLNSLRVKNIQDTFVFEVGKESTITFYTQSHGGRGLVLTGQALKAAYSTYDAANAAVETGDVLAVEPVSTSTFTYTTTGAQKIYVSSYGGDFHVGGVSVKINSADPSISVSPAKKTISLGETTKITATLENADNETVVWSTDNNKVATVEDGVVTAVGVGTANITAAITVNGTEYKAVSEITVVDNATITYSIGDSAAEGEAPKAVTVVKGENVTIPKNDKLYVEGKTLTKWTDGTNDYLPGQAYALNDNVTVTPVFDENTVELGDAETTVNYDFQTKNGASVFTLEGNTGIIVGQAEINGKTIDVKMNINTKPGKFNNTGNNDWAQVNEGTTFTVSVLKGSVVTVGDVFNNTGEYTINGVAKVGNNGSETADADGTMDIVSTNGGYWRSILVTYPKAEKIVEPTINKTKVVTATDNESADPAVAFKYEIKPGTNTITKLTWTATAGTATNKITKDVELSGDTEYTYGLVVVLNSESAKAAGAEAVNSSLEVE